MKATVATALLALGLHSSVPAQTSPDMDLSRLGSILDQDLFNAYNSCNMDRFASMVASDVEFYHDQTGLMQSREKLIAAVQKNICGKIRREIVEGSLQTFELKEYGFVQLGSHRFCDVSAPTCGGVARFVHVWRNESNNWQLARVISYDHRSLQ